MAEYSFTCPDAASTAALGARLGKILRAGDIVLFYGDLGAGKTTLIRGLVQSVLPDADDVVSPTFTLVQTYPIEKGMIYHYDLYRLKENDHAALEELGWEDGLLKGIILVEWPERLADQRPSAALSVTIVPCPDESRILRLTGGADWPKRLEAL